MSSEKQHFWLSGAIDAAGHVVFLTDKDRGECIWKWYFDDVAKQKGLILASMRKYPGELPTTVVLALSERACGKLPKSD